MFGGDILKLATSPSAIRAMNAEAVAYKLKFDGYARIEAAHCAVRVKTWKVYFPRVPSYYRLGK